MYTHPLLVLSPSTTDAIAELFPLVLMIVLALSCIPFEDTAMLWLIPFVDTSTIVQSGGFLSDRGLKDLL